MNNLTKISAVTLLTVFLAACDKPVEKTVTSDSVKQEATQSSEEQKVNDSADVVQGAEDFKKLLEWKQEQEQNFLSVQKELEQQIASQDQEKIGQSLEMFKSKIAEILSGLEALEIKSTEVNAFKVKAKENLVLLNDLVVESVKAMSASSPEAEAQNVIQQKLQSLQQSTTELNKMQVELEKKFLNKE